MNHRDISLFPIYALFAAFCRGNLVGNDISKRVLNNKEADKNEWRHGRRGIIPNGISKSLLAYNMKSNMIQSIHGKDDKHIFVEIVYPMIARYLCDSVLNLL